MLCVADDQECSPCTFLCSSASVVYDFGLDSLDARNFRWSTIKESAYKSRRNFTVLNPGEDVPWKQVGNDSTCQVRLDQDAPEFRFDLKFAILGDDVMWMRFKNVSTQVRHFKKTPECVL